MPRCQNQVEAPRNAVQHLDGEIEELLDSGRPVWGSLSWVNMTAPDAKRLSVGLLLPGTLAPTHGVPVVNLLGREIEMPVGLATLTAAGVTVCLSQVVAAVERFSGPLERGAEAAVRHHSRRREQRHRQAQPAHGLAPRHRRLLAALTRRSAPPV